MTMTTDEVISYRTTAGELTKNLSDLDENCEIHFNVLVHFKNGNSDVSEAVIDRFKRRGTDDETGDANIVVIELAATRDL